MPNTYTSTTASSCTPTHPVCMPVYYFISSVRFITAQTGRSAAQSLASPYRKRCASLWGAISIVQNNTGEGSTSRFSVVGGVCRDGNGESEPFSLANGAYGAASTTEMTATPAPTLFRRLFVRGRVGVVHRTGMESGVGGGRACGTNLRSWATTAATSLEATVSPGAMGSVCSSCRSRR